MTAVLTSWIAAGALALGIPQRDATSAILWTQCEGEEAVEAGAECAFVEMPLFHDRPGDGSITIAVMRIVNGEASRRQLWFLDGGPGDAGRASLHRLARYLPDPQLDFYTVDHRGVGGSALLSCPDQQAAGSPEGSEVSDEEWSDCIDHIRSSRQDLDALTMTETARDLGALIEMAREPGKQVFVMGASYGTLLANRYLQLFPEQADGVVLDGVVPADWGFDEFDAGLDRTGRRVLTRCGLEPACALRLGPDPVAFTEAMFQQLNDSPCQQLGINPQLTRMILGIGLLIDDIPRGYLPALIGRVDRCEWHDQMALLHLFREVFGDLSEPGSHSPVLQRHIALSEVWHDDESTTEEFEAALDGYVMTTAVSASFSRTAGEWPTYDPGDYDDRFAEYDGPMLMLHGSLDPTMPVERLARLREVFSRANQTFVVVPDAGHVVINESECVQAIYLAFLASPTVVPDTACVANAPRLSFAGDDSTSVALFGTADMWGDRVSFVRTFTFYLVFRYQAPLIGFCLLAIGIAVVRRSIRPEIGSVELRHPVRRLVVGAGLWLLVSVGFWFAEFVMPLLLDYDGWTTVLLVAALVMIHITIGRWLISWIGTGYRRSVA